MNKTRQQRLLRLAGSQQWLVHHDQLVDLGIDSKQVQRLRHSGRWEWVSPLVLGKVGAERSNEWRMRLGLLDAGLDSALSHFTGASWWHLPGFRRDPVHVLLPRFDKPRDNHIAVVHRTRILEPGHVKRIDTWPVTTPTRTIFDLAAVCHPLLVERSLDTFWAQRLVTPESLRTMLEQLRGRGRTGIALMRELVEARGNNYRPPESRLERRFEQLLADAGIAIPERQVSIYDGDKFVARVDYVYRKPKIAIFVDSARYHTARLDRRHDDKQTTWLLTLGYSVLRPQEDDIRLRPHLVCEAVVGELEARTAKFARHRRSGVS